MNADPAVLSPDACINSLNLLFLRFEMMDAKVDFPLELGPVKIFKSVNGAIFHFLKDLMFLKITQALLRPISSVSESIISKAVRHSGNVSNVSFILNSLSN